MPDTQTPANPQLQQFKDPNSATYFGYDAGRQQGIAFQNPDQFSKYFSSFNQAAPAPNFDTGKLLAAPGQLVSLGGYTAPGAAPVAVDTKNPTVPSDALGSNVTGQDIRSLLQANLDKQDQLFNQVSGFLTPSDNERALTAKINELDTGLEAGQAKIMGQPAPLPLLLGQSAQLERQQDIQRSSYARILSQETASRTAKLDAAKFLYDANRNKLTDTLNLYKTTAPENIGTQVNQQTGDVYVITKNPITGEVATTKAGNVGAQKSYTSTQVIQDSQGNYQLVGVLPNGKTEVTPLGVQGAATNKYITVPNLYGPDLLYDTTTKQFVSYNGSGVPTTTPTVPGAPGSGTSTALNGNSTLQDFFNVYAPVSDNNNPTAYAATVAQQLGVSPTTPIGQLSGMIPQFANAIATHEGFYQAGSLPQRLNNPGALKFTGQPGATVGANGFAQFKTPQDGWTALQNDILAKMNGNAASPAPESLQDKTFKPYVRAFNDGKQYFAIDEVPPGKLRLAAEQWTTARGVPTLHAPEIASLTNVDTAKSDLKTIQDTLNGLPNSLPLNWFEKLYKSPILTLQKALQTNGQLPAYQTLMAGTLTLLGSIGPIKGVRIGTQLYDEFKRFEPDPTKDTAATAKQKIDNFVALMDNRVDAIFKAGTPVSVGQGAAPAPAVPAATMVQYQGKAYSFPTLEAANTFKQKLNIP